MKSAMEDLRPSSIFVAPLHVVKSDRFEQTQTTDRSVTSQVRDEKLSFQSRLTPPSSPKPSEASADSPTARPQSIFHNYLRAFYPFQPTNILSPSTVTLPLEEGDVVLVHSVHTNGWADGTRLLDGLRGWLPTNYCEAYDQMPMRHLLRALTEFWDTIRSGSMSTLSAFQNQDYMRGLIAGVRYLLVIYRAPGYVDLETDNLRKNVIVSRERHH